MILDPAKLAITVSHHITLLQDPGLEPLTFGIFAGKRKEKCSLEHSRNDSNSVSPYNHSRLQKCHLHRCGGYQYIVVRNKTWGRLQLSFRLPPYKGTEEESLCRGRCGAHDGLLCASVILLDPFSCCAGLKCILWFSCYSWGGGRDCGCLLLFRDPIGTVGKPTGKEGQ